MSPDGKWKVLRCGNKRAEEEGNHGREATVSTRLRLIDMSVLANADTKRLGTARMHRTFCPIFS
jgi:hypothetical protein